MEYFINGDRVTEIRTIYGAKILFEAEEFYKNNPYTNLTNKNRRFMLVKHYLSDLIDKIVFIRLQGYNSGFF